MGKEKSSKTFNLRSSSCSDITESSSTNKSASTTTTMSTNHFEELKSLMTGMNEKIDFLRDDIQSINAKVNDHDREIIRLSDENAMLKDEAAKRDKKILELEVLMEDQINRSLRETLIFRNIKKKPTEKTWDDARAVLSDLIAKHCDISYNDVVDVMDRAHCGKTPSRPEQPPNIYVKFNSWQDSQYIKNEIIKVNKAGKNFINVSQMLSQNINAPQIAERSSQRYGLHCLFPCHYIIKTKKL